MRSSGQCGQVEFVHYQVSPKSILTLHILENTIQRVQISDKAAHYQKQTNATELKT